MKLLFLLLLLLFTNHLFAYKPPPASKPKPKPELEAKNYQLHGESSERLVNIMQRLLLLIKEKEAQANNLEPDQLEDLVETVEELLFYAELMSIKVPATELEENKSVVFNAMANQLYDEVLNIQQIGSTYDAQAIHDRHNRLLNASFERLSRTCNACHQLFRDN